MAAASPEPPGAAGTDTAGPDKADPLAELLGTGALTWHQCAAPGGPVVIWTVVTLLGDATHSVCPRWLARTPAREVQAALEAHHARLRRDLAAAAARLEKAGRWAVRGIAAVAVAAGGSGLQVLGVDVPAAAQALGGPVEAAWVAVAEAGGAGAAAALANLGGTAALLRLAGLSAAVRGWAMRAGLRLAGRLLLPSPVRLAEAPIAADRRAPPRAVG